MAYSALVNSRSGHCPWLGTDRNRDPYSLGRLTLTTCMRPPVCSESSSHTEAAVAHSRTAFLPAWEGLPVVPIAGWVCSRTAEYDTCVFFVAGAWEVLRVLVDSAHRGSAAMLVADLSRSRWVLDTVLNDSLYHLATITDTMSRPPQHH